MVGGIMPNSRDLKHSGRGLMVPSYPFEDEPCVFEMAGAACEEKHYVLAYFEAFCLPSMCTSREFPDWLGQLHRASFLMRNSACLLVLLTANTAERTGPVDHTNAICDKNFPNLPQ